VGEQDQRPPVDKHGRQLVCSRSTSVAPKALLAAVLPLVTVIVTKTPRNEPNAVRQAETA
jgi:hypothetical protein